MFLVIELDVLKVQYTILKNILEIIKKLTVGTKVANKAVTSKTFLLWSIYRAPKI